MKHSVYTGSFAALEKRWTEDVLRIRRNDALSEINVLVGSNVLAAYLKHCLAATGHTVANIRFHTFLDLAERLVSRSDTASEKPGIPDLAHSVIIEKVLASKIPDIFAPLSDSPGFKDTLLETFRDLRDAEVTPQKFDAFQDAYGGKSGRGQHLAALADLYRRYRKHVEAFRDVDDDFRSAIDICNSAARKLPIHQLMVYGVYDVTGQQSRFLSALKSRVAMNYFIPYVDGTVSEFAQPFLHKCIEELEVENVPLPDPSPETTLERLKERHFGLAPIIGSDPGEPLGFDGSCSLVSVPGESRLAIEIVREIFRAIQEGAINAFHEAAVVLRQPEADLTVITEMLRLRGIPYYIHGGVSFSERLLSKAVVALLDLASNSFSRESVLAAMELVAASLPDSEASDWDTQTWRALTRESRFLSGARSWDTGIEAVINNLRRRLEYAGSNAAEMDPEEYETGSNSYDAIAERLKAAQSLLNAWSLLRKAAEWPKELSWKEWADCLFRNFEPLLGASEDWAVFSSVLDKIGNLDTVGTRPVPFESLRTTLVHSIRSLSYPAGRFRKTGVNILSTSAARGLRFPMVIIPGLDEGKFPAKLRQDPLLFDSERQRFENLPVKKKRFEEERLLFDMAAGSAVKRLVLMTSRLEEASDRERIPSQFFLGAAAAAAGEVVTVRELTRETVPGFRSVSLDNPAPSVGEIAVDEGEIRLRLICSGAYAHQSALSAMARLDPDRFDRSLAFDRARWQRSLSSYDGYIRDPRLVQWMARTLPSYEGQVSASRLEAYAKCPYYYFLKYGITLQEWAEADAIDEIDPLERGLTVHSILERFLTGQDLEPSEEDLKRSMESLAGEIIHQRRPAGIADLLWEIEEDALMSLLYDWIAFEKGRSREGLKPERCELLFGKFPDEEPARAFTVDAGRRRFEFRGRIDRVDVSSDGTRARVVDYKTGMRPSSMGHRSRTPLMGGERIQLAVYRGALSVLGEFRDTEFVQGEYLFLQPRDGRTVPCAFSEDELQQASDLLPVILEILGNGMESGVFFARTSGRVRPGGHCDYCEYLTICGKDRMQREERKADDPVVRGFMRIAEIA